MKASEILNTNKECKITNFVKEVSYRKFFDKNFFSEENSPGERPPENIPEDKPLEFPEDLEFEFPEDDEEGALDWLLSEKQLREKYKYFPTDIEARKEFADCTDRTVSTRYSFWKKEWVGREPKKDVDAVGDFLVKVQKRIAKEGFTYDQLSENEEGFYAVIRKTHMVWCKHMIKTALEKKNNNGNKSGE
jgi:hypothetical protein